MNAIKRKVSLFLAGLMVAGVAAAVPASAEGQELNKPSVFVDHRVVVEGDSQEVFVYTDYEGAVDYKLWYRNNEGKWTEGEWVTVENGNVATKLSAGEDVNFSVGSENFISVWVKRSGVDGEDLNRPNPDKEYEAFNYQKVDIMSKEQAEKDEVLHVTGNIDRTIDGLKYTVNGIEGLAEEGIEYKVFAYDYANNKWLAGGEYAEGTASMELPTEGTYLMDVYARKVGSEAKYEAIKLEVVTFEEAATETIDFSTEVKHGQFTSDITVSSEDDRVASYKVLREANGEEVDFGVTAIGETCMAVLGADKEAAVIVELIDANDKVLGRTNVVLGEAGSIEVEAEEGTKPVDPDKEYNATAKLVKKGQFTSDVTVECEDEGVAKFRLYYSEKKEVEFTSGAIALGEVTQVVSIEKPVVAELIDAEGNVLSTVTLDIAE